MGKIHLNISIDQYVVGDARALNLNLSGTCEDALRSKIALMRQDSSEFDLKMLRKKVGENEQKVVEIQQKLHLDREKIKLIQQNIVKKENEQLEKQKEMAKKYNSCANCGANIIPTVKSHKFVIGRICNSCFMSSDNEQIKRWRTEVRNNESMGDTGLSKEE